MLYRPSSPPLHYTPTSVGQLVVDVRVQEEGSLVGPASCHVPHRVPPSPQNQSRNVEPLHKPHTLPDRDKKEREREGGEKDTILVKQQHHLERLRTRGP